MVLEALKSQSFGVLTKIDVQKTLQQKIDVDFKPYQIVGVCNPRFAYRALSADDSIRLLLLYIFVLMEESDGVVVRIQNPEVMFSVVDEITKASLVEFPQEVKRSLQAELLALKYRGLTERFLP